MKEERFDPDPSCFTVDSGSGFCWHCLNIHFFYPSKTKLFFQHLLTKVIWKIRSDPDPVFLDGRIRPVYWITDQAGLRNRSDPGVWVRSRPGILIRILNKKVESGSGLNIQLNLTADGVFFYPYKLFWKMYDIPMILFLPPKLSFALPLLEFNGLIPTSKVRVISWTYVVNIFYSPKLLENFFTW